MSRLSFHLISDKDNTSGTERLWNFTNKQSDFVSMATHQIKTPLAGLKWTLKMLLDGDVGEMNAEQKEWLQKSFDSNERVLLLIDEMLDSIRIDEDKFILSKKEVDIAKLFSQAIQVLDPYIAKKKIQVLYEVNPEGPIIINADAEKLVVAFQNLFENAIRYSRAGDKILIRIEKETGDVKVSIKDSGIGIPELEKSNIFSRFFRASNASHFQEKGSGLGLFIARGIIEKHGGKIWFESSEKTGTTFYFIIPTT